MKEKQTAYAIRRHLDSATAALPYRVTERLSRARADALTHLADKPTRYPAFGRRVDPDTPPFLPRAAMAVIPLLVVFAGLAGLAQWNDERRIQELAELDNAVVMDDLPLAALADDGFGVFMQNTRR